MIFNQILLLLPIIIHCGTAARPITPQARRGPALPVFLLSSALSSVIFQSVNDQSTPDDSCWTNKRNLPVFEVNRSHSIFIRMNIAQITHMTNFILERFDHEVQETSR
uniref:Secreted protein n=1 Tax=Meloidogyne incognita TaxID=6306 RepID=A0A914L8M7_MELIC